MNKYNKGQEEIVGFVLIVVLVAVILLILLAINLRNKNPIIPEKSEEIYSFLESTLQYTSSCATAYEPAYSTINELMRNCYDGRNCISGKKSCDILNETLIGILDSSWKVGPESSVKGYVMNITRRTNKTSEEFLYIKKGSCSTEIRGAEYPSYPLSAELKICY
jgi:hypothetical protein